MALRALGITIDQLAVLVEIIETGSFTGAARQHHRTQGSVSYHVRRLEEQLGVALFERTGRRPVLTDAGRAVAVHARRILREIEQLADTAAQLQAGVEASVSICVDTLFPPARIAEALSAFEERFPRVPLSISTGVFRAPAEALKNGVVDLAIAPPLVGAGMRMAEVGKVQFVPVCAPNHPLIHETAPIPRDVLLDHRHLVLRSGGKLPGDGGEPGSVWRLDDAATRRGLLLTGVGWARLVEWHVRDDLEAGRLVALDIAGWTGLDHVALAVMIDPDRGQGPATRWLFDFLASHPIC